MRGTREGVRRPRGGARDEFPDSNRPPPPADGPDGKLPPAEGTSRSCYRRALTSPHSLTPQPFPVLTRHQSLRDDELAVNFRTT